MNKSVKIILAIAIGIIFPILVLFIGLVFYPSKNYESLQVTSPQVPSYTKCATYGNTRSTYTTYDKACQKKIDDQYQNDLNKYNSKLSDYNAARKQVVMDRIQIALIAAILGYILAMISYKFSPITVGMAGGSTVLIVFSSYYSLLSRQTMGSLVTILFSISFVVLIAMLFFIDKVMPLPKVENFVQKK
jgi:hypothetical protein